jgi:RNA polymerase sigma factor (sigma-70 family)
VPQKRPELDPEILVRAGQGDEHAMHCVIERYAPLVKVVVERVLPDMPNEVDDTVEDVLIRCIEVLRAGKFNPDHTSKPSAWFAQVARNGAVDKRRARSDPHAMDDQPGLNVRPKMDALPEVDDLPADTKSADELAEMAQVREWLQHAVTQLPKKYRTVVQERLEGLTDEEIASRHGIEVATVRTRFSRALQVLMALWLAFRSDVPRR